MKDTGLISTDLKREMNRYKWIKENKLIAIIVLFAFVYYLVQMFLNRPWYDELYTYYYFISRGPVYAAIHWPVPNNHIGYSVISACLDVIPNSFIRLRLISVIAATVNIGLIYAICRKTMNERLSVIAPLFYMGANLVNSLAIQGRGYTLAITCYLTAILCVYNIALGDDRRRNYVGFVISLTYGLYILTSSVYWVIPICLVAGVFLLMNKKMTQLIRLVISGVVAAAITFCLYSLVWLAIGANLMCKNAESIYFGMSQVSVILKTPFGALKTGMDYMLATPYIQSIDRKEAVSGMLAYFTDLFSMFYSNMGYVVAVIAVIGVIGGLIIAVRKRENIAESFLGMYVSLSIVMAPIILIIQSVHPYKRVLSFISLPIAFTIAGAISIIIEKSISSKSGKYIEYAISSVLIVCVIILVTGAGYRINLADRENDIADVLSYVDVTDIDSIYYTDDYQKYVMKFYYDITPEEVSLEDANYVLVPNELEDENYEAYEWPMLCGYNSEMNDYIDSEFALLQGTEKYKIYKRK